MSSTSFEYKVGIVGPTRVGKTSLIASILNDSKQLLRGTPASLETENPATRRKLTGYATTLKGSLKAGEFHPGALSGTEAPFEYRLRLASGVPDQPTISLAFLDYPGAWLDSMNRRPDQEAEWAKCEEWIEDSSVLIIPVEATILMEATTKAYKRAVPQILATQDVETVVEKWAKKRKERFLTKGEPAMLIFVPIKCESYFNDNGGSDDRSADLFQEFQDVYEDVIKTASGEFENVQMMYVPVDTIGCVEIVNTRWIKDPLVPDNLVCEAEYLVRPPARQQIKGAKDVLILLCKSFIDATSLAVDNDAKSLREESRRLDPGQQTFWGDVGRWWRNEPSWIEQKAHQGRVVYSADTQTAVAAGLRETIEILASNSLTERAEKL